MAFYLFSGDSHFIFDICKHGWLDEITAISVSLTTSQKFGTFSFTGIDKCQNLLELIFVHLRSLFDVQIEWIAYISLSGTFNAPRDKFVINSIFHENARSGATAGKQKLKSHHNSYQFNCWTLSYHWPYSNRNTKYELRQNPDNVMIETLPD